MEDRSEKLLTGNGLLASPPPNSSPTTPNPASSPRWWQRSLIIFGLLRFAFGLFIGRHGLIWIDSPLFVLPDRPVQKNKQSFFFLKRAGLARTRLD
jgi:hypothetical protein